jgi:hypothetical protein
MAADVDQLLSTFSNPEMAGLLTRQPSELTDAQNMSVSAWFAAFLRIREFAWFQYRRGIMDESTWRSYVSMAKRIVQLPALGPWWTLYSQEMDVGFRAYIDELLKAKP